MHVLCCSLRRIISRQEMQLLGAKMHRVEQNEIATDHSLSTRKEVLREERQQMLCAFQECFARQQIHVLRRASTLTWADIYELLVEYEKQAPWTLRPRSGGEASRLSEWSLGCHQDLARNSPQNDDQPSRTLPHEQ
jgi:hypothetical protein